MRLPLACGLPALMLIATAAQAGPPIVAGETTCREEAPGCYRIRSLNTFLDLDFQPDDDEVWVYLRRARGDLRCPLTRADGAVLGLFLEAEARADLQGLQAALPAGHDRLRTFLGDAASARPAAAAGAAAAAKPVVKAAPADSAKVAAVLRGQGSLAGRWSTLSAPGARRFQVKLDRDRGTLQVVLGEDPEQLEVTVDGPGFRLVWSGSRGEASDCPALGACLRRFPFIPVALQELKQVLRAYPHPFVQTLDGLTDQASRDRAKQDEDDLLQILARPETLAESEAGDELGRLGSGVGLVMERLPDVLLLDLPGNRCQVIVLTKDRDAIEAGQSWCGPRDRVAQAACLANLQPVERYVQLLDQFVEQPGAPGHASMAALVTALGQAIRPVAVPAAAAPAAAAPAAAAPAAAVKPLSPERLASFEAAKAKPQGARP